MKNIDYCIFDSNLATSMELIKTKTIAFFFGFLFITDIL